MKRREDRESAAMDWQEADVAASGLHSPPFASDDDDNDWEQYDSDWEDYVDGSAEIAAIGAAAKLRVRARAASEQRAALIAAGGEKGEAADDGDDYRGEHETGQNSDGDQSLDDVYDSNALARSLTSRAIATAVGGAEAHGTFDGTHSGRRMPSASFGSERRELSEAEPDVAPNAAPDAAPDAARPTTGKSMVTRVRAMTASSSQAPGAADNGSASGASIPTPQVGALATSLSDSTLGPSRRSSRRPRTAGAARSTCSASSTAEAGTSADAPPLPGRLSRPTASSLGVAGGGRAKIERMARQIEELKARLRLAKMPTSSGRISPPALRSGGGLQVGAAAARTSFGQHEGQHWSENPSASALRATNAQQARQIDALKKKLRWAMHLVRSARPTHEALQPPDQQGEPSVGHASAAGASHAEALGMAEHDGQEVDPERPLTVDVRIPAAGAFATLNGLPTALNEWGVAAPAEHTSLPRTSVLRETIRAQEKTIKELRGRVTWERRLRFNEQMQAEGQERYRHACTQPLHKRFRQTPLAHASTQANVLHCVLCACRLT